MGLMSRLGHGLMQQLRDRLGVQAVVFGDRTADCEMVEDAMSQWSEMSDTKTVNAEEAGAAVENAGSLADVLADVTRAQHPLATGRSESGAEAPDAQADSKSELGEADDADTTCGD